MRIDLVATSLPGRSFGAGCGPDPSVGAGNVHVGIQKRKEPTELFPGDADGARWSFDVEVKDDGDVKGPHVQGKKGDRFFYLTWGVVDDDEGAVRRFVMLRRAKLMLSAVPPAVWQQAEKRGVLVGTLGLTMANGTPLCAAVRPPIIEWTAG